MQGGVDAHGDAGEKREDRGDEGELERRRHASPDQIGDRLLELIGNAEIEPRRVSEKAEGLHDRGIVEPELLAQRRALALGRLDADHLVHRVADIAEQQECDEADRDQHADRGEEATDDEGDHLKAPLGSSRGLFGFGQMRIVR